jgi:hypothetical protein
LLTIPLSFIVAIRWFYIGIVYFCLETSATCDAACTNLVGSSLE